MIDKKALLASLIAGYLVSLSLATSAQTTNNPTEPGKLTTVKIEADALGNTTEQTGAYTTGSMNTATKLDLSIRETPQSVSVITNAQIEDFNLTTINDALEIATGVTVEQVETDRTYFTARGFEINNFQIDGVGTPLHWGIQNGDLDMAIYDRVEVVRGASGLMAGIGNPSATISLVRKRPTAETQASLKLSHGRWNDTRGDADLSGEITDNIRGRLVMSKQEKDSYLRDYHKDLSIAYGIAETDIGSNSLLTAGISQQSSKADSPMWGALTLVYTDGTLTNFDRSANTSADWAYWDTKETKSFVELHHSFDNGWSAKATYTNTKLEEDSELFYIYGDLEPDNSGLTGYASEYDMNNRVEQLEISATGSFMIGDYEQQIVAGVNQAEGDIKETSLYDAINGFPPIPNMAEWDGNAVYPNFTNDIVNFPNGSDFNDKQTGAFVASHVNISEDWHAIAGLRAAYFESKGKSYDEPEVTDDTKTIPYGGIMYDFHKNITAYASYSETYLPQSETGENHKRLSPTEGTNKEVGLKAELFDGQLNASAAMFEAEHLNNATVIKYDDNGNAIYAGKDYFSQGFEFEVAGKVSENFNAVLGYTNLTVDDENGEVAKTYIPKQMIKLTTNYRPEILPALKLGANINWQSEIYIRGTPVTQDSLTLINAFASYEFTDNLSAGINLTNITDETYFPSLYWSQAFYGEPRSINASITWNL